MKNREWDLLVQASLGSESEVGLASFGADKLASRELIWNAANHGLLPALGESLIRNNRLDILTHETQKLVQEALTWSRQHTSVHVAEALILKEALAALGIRVVFTKGIVAQAQLYGRSGMRRFSDIDLLISPLDKTAISNLFVEHGYAPNVHYVSRTNSMVPSSARTRAIYKLYPDHLPHFLRLCDSPGVSHLIVDVALSLTWHRSSWQPSVEHALSSAQDVEVAPGLYLPGMGDVESFLFFALHLFREAWFERTVQKKDVRLSQFSDVFLAWNRVRLSESKLQAARDSIASARIEPPIAWVAHYVDAIYGSSLVEDLGIRQYLDATWLQSIAGTNGGYLMWDGDIQARLLNRQPQGVHDGKKPKYADAARGNP